jgi:ABC-type nitrate/sulfonate/bicarbonate transport system permease component
VTVATRPPSVGRRGGPAVRLGVGVARSVGTFVLVGALLLGLWVGFLEVLDVNPYVGKTPTQVWEWVTDPALGAERRSELAEATGETLLEAGLGFLTGLAAAVVVAIAFTLSRPLERAVMPIALALRSVPIVAMVPLLAYIFGRELAGSLVIVSIVVWFPALVLVSTGLRSVRPEALDLLRAYDAGPLTQLVKVRLPSAVPSLLASAKVCAPLAILGSLLNGWMSTGEGLGALMSLSTITAEYVKLWAAVVIVTVVSVVFAAVVTALEQVAYARWAPERSLR